MFCLPVVATDGRGLPDIVVNGEPGFLVPSKDAKLIAERLEILIYIQICEQPWALAAGDRKRYEENFTLEKCRNRMEEALSSMA